MSLITQIKRQMFIGNYPEACAEIKVKESGKRHVLFTDSDICDKIRSIQDQILIFADAGILTCTFEPGKIIIYLGEIITIEFIYDEILHVFISSANMENLNKLIYVLRRDTQYQNLNFDIDETSWHSLQNITLEPTDKYFGIFEPRKLFLIPPMLIGTDELYIAEEFLHPDAGFWDSVFAQVDNPLHFR